MNKLFSKDVLKLVILIIVILLGLGYGIASFFQDVQFDIGDNEAEFATKWLEQSNNNPESCRKLTENSKKWFDNFIKNRQRLGILKERYLKSKQSAKNKKHQMTKVIFASSFTHAKRVDEIVTLITDKKRQIRVTKIEYRYENIPHFTSGSELDNSTINRRKIIRLAKKCSTSYDARRFKYFNKVSINYSGYINKYSAKTLKSRRDKTGSATSRKHHKIIYRSEVPGITDLEQCTIINRVTYMIKNRKRQGQEFICLKKDNRLKNPQWLVYYYNIRIYR